MPTARKPLQTRLLQLVLHEAEMVRVRVAVARVWAVVE